MKANLGCGGDVREGWLNVDAFVVREGVVRDDVTVLATIEDGSLDHILAQDVLEHVTHLREDEVLKLWARKLKVGGTLEIRTPDFARQVELWKSGVWDDWQMTRMVFAHQDHGGNFHTTMFTEWKLRVLLERNGFWVDWIHRMGGRWTKGVDSDNANLHALARRV